MKKEPIVVQEDFRHTQQSWYYTKIVRVGKNDVFRTRIRRDAYDFQSYALIERWNGQEWKEVVNRPIAQTLCKAVVYVNEQLTAEQKGFFEFDADELLHLAIQVVF